MRLLRPYEAMCVMSVVDDWFQQVSRDQGTKYPTAAWLESSIVWFHFNLPHIRNLSSTTRMTEVAPYGCNSVFALSNCTYWLTQRINERRKMSFLKRMLEESREKENWKAGGSQSVAPNCFSCSTSTFMLFSIATLVKQVHTAGHISGLQALSETYKPGTYFSLILRVHLKLSGTTSGYLLVQEGCSTHLKEKTKQMWKGACSFVRWHHTLLHKVCFPYNDSPMARFIFARNNLLSGDWTMIELTSWNYFIPAHYTQILRYECAWNDSGWIYDWRLHWTPRFVFIVPMDLLAVIFCMVDMERKKCCVLCSATPIQVSSMWTWKEKGESLFN